MPERRAQRKRISGKSLFYRITAAVIVLVCLALYVWWEMSQTL
ncbi:hypothetical protein ACFQI7_04900 [Paenibacillus allorhizosphaerae]|uniref:Uncharacterized protein n=1 Tax=Paenibacillus allorhizosphaerae TaxID=2849866 RepID=A0ABN7TCM2_9BACL|nr:hypothetical protein [Paenibacillus allorhizosphaerae]CAG7622581.1 hypothetical protein PAECIP111802_00844 [Paenibacillus allorhizosphaerae]